MTMQNFVLDACALIAFFNDEPGADRLESLMQQAQNDEVRLFVATINVYEVFYDSLRRTTPIVAQEILEKIYSLPVTIVETFDRSLIPLAAFFKIHYKVSVADSVALALARQLDARLVSTDHHEFDVIEKSGQSSFFWLR